MYKAIKMMRDAFCRMPCSVAKYEKWIREAETVPCRASQHQNHLNLLMNDVIRDYFHVGKGDQSGRIFIPMGDVYFWQFWEND
jgi:hypothetical protein